MIEVEAIAKQLDEILDSGMEDARWRIELSALGQQYSPGTVLVDDLDAHEIYERACSQARIEAALIRHGEYRDRRGRVMITHINGIDLRP